MDTRLRRALLRGGLPAAAESTASPSSPAEKDALTLAGQLELGATQAYTAAQTLPFVQHVTNPAITGFLTRALAQHTETATTLGTALGSPLTTIPDDVAETLRLSAAPADLPALIDLLNALEQTLLATAVSLGDVTFTAATRTLFGQIAATGGQRVAFLRVIHSLVGAGATAELVPPAVVAQLPAAIGSVAFPESFISTDGAIKVSG